jgi:STELLO glycosyltransferases
MGEPDLRGAVVMTSIAAPNDVMRQIADQCRRINIPFYVIGDTKSPSTFRLKGCTFLSVEDQIATGLEFARICPTRHYARKNIGYLLAIKGGADYITETDDDNVPSPEFYVPLPLQVRVSQVREAGWVNVYRYFTDSLIWPRGLPLDEINSPLPALGPSQTVRVPIQQGLANENPDVDAIYRLTLPLPFSFERRLRIALGNGAWCPFNSQNTTHYREAFPLLYLPAYCSFRMTDIWRSFVAQRVAWANGWSVLFREATVVQDRNDHDLMQDFRDEISGYVANRRIAELLSDIPCKSGLNNISAAMTDCYQALVDNGFIGSEEMTLLSAFLRDFSDFR